MALLPCAAADEPAHWAYQPLISPAVPSVRNTNWIRNPIDRFTAARLNEHALSPAPEADKRTIIRRVYFDLIGLPPTPEDVRAFVEDTKPDAFERVVNRLLA